MAFDWIMTPASQAAVIPQQPQQAPVATPANRKLSFDEVSKLFSLPIADAASILGVCTSVLKRICRKNGIGRWPYRKYLAGKTVEEIKRDAAREKTKELAELSKAEKQRLDPNLMPSTSAGLPLNLGDQVLNRTSDLGQETFKMQRGVSNTGHGLQQQENRLSQYNKWPNTAPFNPTRNVPTYMDEFKYGFPSKGLSSVSMKWWGSSSNEATEPATEEEEKQGSCGLSNETSMCMVAVGDQTESNLEENGLKSDPTSLLCSLRKKAVQCGHNSVKAGVSRSCVTHKLSKRQRVLLLRVFKSSCPDQWKDIHC